MRRRSTAAWLTGATLMMAAAAVPAAADVIVPGGRPQPRTVEITGPVTALAGDQITVADTRGGPARSFTVGRPADALGLRVGDTVAVTLRGFGNPFAAPVASIDRALPGGGPRVRVYDAATPAAAAPLGQAPGCWLSGPVEVCFVTPTQAVAMRHGADKPACTMRLAPVRGGEGAGRGWSRTGTTACTGGASWAATRLHCDAAAQSCTFSGPGGAEERLAMTRR